MSPMPLDRLARVGQIALQNNAQKLPAKASGLRHAYVHTNVVTIAKKTIKESPNAIKQKPLASKYLPHSQALKIQACE